MTDHMKDYLSIKEAAGLLGVSPQTLRNWEKRGELVPYRNPINKYRMYKPEQIEEFLEKMRKDRVQKGTFKLKVVSVKE